MSHLKLEKILLALVFLTIAALVFSPLILKKTLKFGPDENLTAVLDSDRLDQGNSIVRWIDKQNLEWQCELRKAYDYPFCTVQLYLNDHPFEGVDLSDFDEMIFWLDYEGPGKTVRVFLRNINPAYTKPDEPRTAKFNTVELNVDEVNRETRLRFEDFRVADWWLLMFEIPVALSQPEFTNVSMIEFQTGSGVSEGAHRFKLRGIRFEGQWISREQWYFTIIVFWISVIVAFLGYRIFSLNMEVKIGRLKQKELSQINLVLDRRSKILEERSKIDPLTGAFNRLGLDSVVYEGLHKWNREKMPLTLILFDVDYFKAVNDNHGHAAGDEVLVSLSRIVKENIRLSDKFARWGGEEFIIVSSDCTADQGYELAEKIRQVIAAADFGNGLHITASFGVAEIKENEVLEDLFERADRALLKAKASGRNRVCRDCAPDGSPDISC